MKISRKKKSFLYNAGKVFPHISISWEVNEPPSSKRFKSFKIVYNIRILVENKEYTEQREENAGKDTLWNTLENKLQNFN